MICSRIISAITYEALTNQLTKHGGLLENLSIRLTSWNSHKIDKWSNLKFSASIVGSFPVSRKPTWKTLGIWIDYRTSCRRRTSRTTQSTWSSSSSSRSWTSHCSSLEQFNIGKATFLWSSRELAVSFFTTFGSFQRKLSFRTMSQLRLRVCTRADAAPHVDLLENARLERRPPTRSAHLPAQANGMADCNLRNLSHFHAHHQL